MWIAFLFVFVILLCWLGVAYSAPNYNSVKKNKLSKKQQYVIKNLSLKDKNGTSLDDRKIYALSAEKLGMD